MKRCRMGRSRWQHDEFDFGRARRTRVWRGVVLWVLFPILAALLVVLWRLG